ncbi:MAG: hypothetical protein DMF26_12045 [Verrucomicrobia bacterium]|nr:MAG: hypothetical protein DMF26_12045 [Verrucomicrobiota bacterium]
MKTKTIPLRNLMNCSPLRAFLLIPFVLACFALSPTAQAVDPPPDGGYPSQNTAEGEHALFSLITGFNNTAIGFKALFSLTTGNNNTASGFEALNNNSTGGFNTATGSAALFSNTTGQLNTAIGFEALYNNTTGNNNTASGFEALVFNTEGFENTANGIEALFSNTTGSVNTASGFEALFSNTTGFNNTATGIQALQNNTTGNNNTAIGFVALLSNTTGSDNIALGFQAGQNLTTGSNNIDIGNLGVAGDSKRIRIGTAGTQTKTFIAGISGATVAGGVGVIVGSNGQLGTVVSSNRFKDAIKPMDKASEAILALRPVTFYYKKELDPDGIPQFGLVAEQVEKVNPDLVARDEEGKPYTVRYEAVNAMLLNEFLKEHRIVQELKSAAAKQEAIIAHQQKQIEALTAGLQKVSAQVEMSRVAPQVVVNNQ